MSRKRGVGTSLLIGIFAVVAVLLFLSGVLVSCTAQNTQATPTNAGASAGDIAVQLLKDDLVLKATQQFIEGQRLEKAAIMTATQQVIDAANTQQAHIENGKATQKAEAATAQSWNVTVEAGKAQDTATAQVAVANATNTAIAQASATAQAVLDKTATIEARGTATGEKKTQEAPFVWAQQTAVKAQSDSAEMAAERERMTNGLIAWGPWVIVFIAVGIIGFVVWRKSQVGTVERDVNGMLPGVIFFHNGKKQLISPDRMFSPVITVDSTGVSAPQLADPDRQEGATRRAQAVEAINALPQAGQRQGFGLMNQTFNAATRPAIEVVEEGQVRDWVNEAETKLGEEA